VAYFFGPPCILYSYRYCFRYRLSWCYSTIYHHYTHEMKMKRAVKLIEKTTCWYEIANDYNRMSFVLAIFPASVEVAAWNICFSPYTAVLFQVPCSVLAQAAVCMPRRQLTPPLEFVEPNDYCNCWLWKVSWRECDRNLKRVGAIAEVDHEMVVRHVDLDAAVEHTRHRNVLQPQYVGVRRTASAGPVLGLTPAAVDTRHTRRTVPWSCTQKRQ